MSLCYCNRIQQVVYRSVRPGIIQRVRTRLNVRKPPFTQAQRQQHMQQLIFREATGVAEGSTAAADYVPRV